MKSDISTFIKDLFLTYKEHSLVENIKLLISFIKPVFINKSILKLLFLTACGLVFYYFFENIMILKIVAIIVGVLPAIYLFSLIIMNIWIVIGSVIILIIVQIYKLIKIFSNYIKNVASETIQEKPDDRLFTKTNKTTEKEIFDDVINKLINKEIDVEEAIETIAENDTEIEEKIRKSAFGAISEDAKKLQQILKKIADENK